MPYHFRPVTDADIPLLRDWRARPHVRQWWGAPELEDDGVPALTPFARRTDPPYVYLRWQVLNSWNSLALLDLEG
ncbi:MAG: hypothetical protein ACJ8FO_10405 [Sphingomicrobium sp.]